VAALTAVLAQTSDLFLPPQIPDFDKLVLAPCGEPFPSRARRDGLNAGKVRGEYERGFESCLGLVILGCRGTEGTLKTVQ
jgi:hypothetical protein